MQDKKPLDDQALGLLGLEVACYIRWREIRFSQQPSREIMSPYIRDSLERDNYLYNEDNVRDIGYLALATDTKLAEAFANEHKIFEGYNKAQAIIDARNNHD